MTWGKPAIEALFDGNKGCDLCRRAAIAFHAGRTRCEEHLTEEMRAYRREEETRNRPYYPGRPQVIGP
jgi:hypothetical protein